MVRLNDAVQDFMNELRVVGSHLHLRQSYRGARSTERRRAAYAGHCDAVIVEQPGAWPELWDQPGHGEREQSDGCTPTNAS